MKTIHELKAERLKLVETRQDVTGSLMELRARKSTMQAHIHASQHAALAATDARLSEQIVAINHQIRQAHEAEHLHWKDGQSHPSPFKTITSPLPVPTMESKAEKRALIEDLAALRDHYETMGADRTRLPSIRTMGAEISKALSELIRKHIKP